MALLSEEEIALRRRYAHRLVEETGWVWNLWGSPWRDPFQEYVWYGEDAWDAWQRRDAAFLEFLGASHGAA